MGNSRKKVPEKICSSLEGNITLGGMKRKDHDSRNPLHPEPIVYGAPNKKKDGKTVHFLFRAFIPV
jgi:hypothetical protein